MTRFFFDSNQWCGFVDNPAQLASIINAHKGVGGWSGRNLLDARRDDSNDAAPSFGFRLEHRGTETLGDWLRANWFQL